MFQEARFPTAVREIPRPEWIREAKEGSRRQGVLFEKKIQRKLAERFGPSRVICNKWFEFEDGGERRICSPDSILFLESGPVVLEMKLAHCEKAWKQLNRLYIPVMEAMYPGLRFRGVEICQEFRPEVYWPELVLIGDVTKAPKKGTGVHVVRD